MHDQRPSSASSGAPADHVARVTLSAAVITISDTRTTKTDASGDAIDRLLLEAGQRVAWRLIVPDEITAIRDAVKREIDDRAVALVITTGGTGVTTRDVTPEAVEPLLARQLPGFGELFRALSFEEVGSAAMLSRAFAGIGRDGDSSGDGGEADGALDTAVFCLPGSVKAVTLAMTRLIVPELGHLARMLGRG